MRLSTGVTQEQDSNLMVDIPEDLQSWVALAERYGWTAEDTEDGKLKLLPPEDLIDPSRNRPARPLVIGKSGRDSVGYPNLARQLRRLGVPIPTTQVKH